MYLSPAKCFSAPLHHELDHNTPGHQATRKQRSMAETPARSNRIKKNFTPAVMNSTVQDHRLGTESREAMSCDLSTINNPVLCLKRITDTPAKVFARLKAKVQRLNSEEHREESVAPVQLGGGDSFHTHMQQPAVDGDDLSDGQDTYVLTLSPPKSMSKNPENPQRTPYLVIEGHNPDLFHKPVIDLENMLTEPFTQFKPQQGTSGMKNSSRSRNQGALRQRYVSSTPEPYVLLERMPHDSSAQPVPAKPFYLKTRVKPRGDHGVFGEMSVQDDAENTVDNESREDMLQGLGSAPRSQPLPQQPGKMSNRQSDCLEAPLQTHPNLMEDSLLQQSPRISIPRKKITAAMSKQQNNKTDKALEGKTNMNEVHLTDWVLKLHNRELIVDGIRVDNKIPWHSSCITERVSSNIVKTASGGTYILVGKMSNYRNSSFPSWFIKKFLFGFPEMWKEYLHKFLTGDEGEKHRQRNNSAPCEQQNKRPSKKRISKRLQSKDLLTQSEKVAAEQPPQEEQSDRMYLRRGRSYSRERNSTGSESEVSKFGVHRATAEDGLFAVQAPERKLKTQLQKKHLQSHKLPTSYPDSETISTQSQVKKNADRIFSSPNPKSCRKNISKQKSKSIPSIACMAENEDSSSPHREIKVTNTKNKQKPKVKEKNKSCMISDAGDKSPPSEPIREDKSNNSVSALRRMQNRKKSRVFESTRNETFCQVDKHPEELKKTASPHPPVSSNSGKKTNPPRSRKTNRRNHKEQTATHPMTEQDALERAWTDQELQKLNEAVNSLPKHKSGYWVNVSQVVGTRSAEECQKQYTECYQAHGRYKGKGKHKAKAVKTDKPGKETAPITAKVGTLKRKKQMWEFLDHMPRDDHDDVFAGSPLQSKQIKLPVWSTNGDELDFGHLQNPQTPISSMFSSVKTPQCLHITPGMLRSVNRDNNDKYIYHLQKGKRQDSCGRKGSPRPEKIASVQSVRKTKKRCVAEDDNFVVWNMLSDKDGPSGRGEEDEEEEDDYFMDEY
ncbi:Mis18-binding protein 1 [Bagarius yarrelli]|uniref:Mis18-binding protein 1 n=1 Tax=Bagarius yarrelli TaxID=175774 RepID=A0A556V5Z5_BAGYA|nr:Mis18-binding protein 1 [Bagarius yarrelli]